MTELIDLSVINLECHMDIGFVIQVQRILNQNCHKKVFSFLKMELLSEMRVERLVFEFAVQQCDTFERTGSIAIFPSIMMNESRIEIFVKTLADLFSKGLFKSKKDSAIKFLVRV